jgi:hypothetical protein
MTDDQGPAASLPLVRANDNPHIARPLMKDQLASEAFDLYSEYEPTGAFALIAPDAEWASEPANIKGGRSIRARPDPTRQVRDDKDSQRVSDNKGILDKQLVSPVGGGPTQSSGDQRSSGDGESVTGPAGTQLHNTVRGGV